MPFALEETTHIFTNTPTGGRQDVVVDNPGDIANIEQIRIHLAEEASKFRNGDFSDPEAIHGPDMPGLSTLQARYGDIEVGLSNTDAGASIIYTADDPDVVAAIHDWFAAQTNDHGDHAEHNRQRPTSWTRDVRAQIAVATRASAGRVDPSATPYYDILS